MMKYVETGTNFIHSVGYEYDKKNNLTEQVEVINGTTHTTAYTYDDDNRIKTVTVDGSTITYSYDDYGRLTKQETKKGETTVLTEEYTFTDATINGTAVTSSQIATYKVTSGGQTTTYTYTYDDNGNILSVSDGTKTTSYVYDSANQLIRENNQSGNFTHTWEYDNGGNILNRKEYAYTTGTLGTPTKTVTYGYTDPNWGDLLTEYNGQEIEYDEIGNPEDDGTWTYQWEHGRQLASMSDGTATWSYTYNADGLRTAKTDGTSTWNYVYNGSQLTQMTKGTDTLSFTYDASGIPLTVVYNNMPCYYETNLQGDVIAIRNYFGTVVVSYSYDAWGNLLATTGSAANSLGVLNPLRYRGYVYDTETGLYYLQSRYYNPKVGRFINGDGLVATGQGFTGNNMFAYCGNNPVCNADYSGDRYCAATSISKEKEDDRSYSCYWQTQVTLERYNPVPIGQYSGGNVYLVSDPNIIRTNFPGDVVVLDRRGPGKNQGVEIMYSFLITNTNQQREILMLLYNFELANPTGWNRTVESMEIEWIAHNDSHTIFTLTPFNRFTLRAAHVFFNNAEEGWSYWDHTIGRFLRGK